MIIDFHTHIFPPRLIEERELYLQRDATFAELFAAYDRQITWLVETAVAGVRAHELQWPQINPSPLIAATIDDCRVGKRRRFTAGDEGDRVR